jgi:hypothetical protein
MINDEIKNTIPILIVLSFSKDIIREGSDSVVTLYYKKLKAVETLCIFIFNYGYSTSVILVFFSFCCSK